MTSIVDIPNMKETLEVRKFPTVTIWNRLEGRPRSVDFERALRVEIRDALWMVTRQWQMGELQGDDAGTPVTARFQLSQAQLDGYRAQDFGDEAFDDGLPLEARVERRALRDALENGGIGQIDLRVAMGRRFLKLIPSFYHPRYVTRHAFVAPDPEDPAKINLSAHPDVLARLQLLDGRALDGYRLYRFLKDNPAAKAWDGIPVLEADKAAIEQAAVAFVGWWEALLLDAPAAAAFDHGRLEHRFQLTAPTETGAKRLLAEEYPGGRLDWTAFSVDPKSDQGRGKLQPAMTVLPAPTRFNGMPDHRWWAFEDGRTNLGAVRTDATDIGRMLYLEFALVYGNDWYTIPVDLPFGISARVEGLLVTNVFGEQLWVQAAGRGLDDDWQRWSMFTLDVAGQDPHMADMSLLVLPTLAQSDTGPPLEDVSLLRDEVANMVWGIETMVPLATGTGRRGGEAARQSLAARKRLIDAAPVDPPPMAAPIRYRVMSPVAEHWIPFIPVHVPNSVRETQMQRAAMPRLLEGDPNPPEKIRPRSTLLRHGLDQVPAQAYFIHEEEVPRAGTRVTVNFQRTRWKGGKVCVWLATKRETGRGEGKSGLSFDQVLPSIRAPVQLPR